MSTTIRSIPPAAGQAAHTPTPWKITHGPASEIIEDPHGCPIAICPNFGAGVVPTGYVAPWHMSDANAAFIVRACNSHAALVDFAEAFFVDGRLLIPKQDQLSILIRLHAAALQLAKQ